MKDGIVQAGFVGVGNFAFGHHLPNAKENPHVRIRALCDLDADLLARRAGQFPCDYTAEDARKLMDDPEIDLLVVCTRHDQHARLSVEAMKAGKDVLCEKPMSHLPEDMPLLVRTQRETGRRYVVGHNRRFAPAMVAAKELVRPRPRPLMALYRIVDNAELWPGWPMLAENGGKIVSECSHVFDLLCWLLDADPVSVHAIGWLEDNNVVSLSFSDGSIASVVSGGMGSEIYPKELLEVFCCGATVAVDHFLHLRVDGIPGAEDRFFPYKKDPWAHVSERLDMDGFRLRMKEWRKNILPEDFERRSYGNLPTVDKGHAAELDALVQAIRQNAPGPADAVEAARATVCCFKAVESLKSGQPAAMRPEDYSGT